MAWALELGLAPWSRGVDPGPPVPWSLGPVVPGPRSLWSLWAQKLEYRIGLGHGNFFMGVARSGLACLGVARIPWSCSPMVLWSHGPLVPWSLGPLVFGCGSLKVTNTAKSSIWRFCKARTTANDNIGSS